MGKRRWKDEDGGQLMLLAGIVITISFILTSLTLAQVSSLERQAVNERKIELAEEWRFLHERLGPNFDVAISPEMSIDTFQNTTFETIQATFRGIEAEKGYDAVMRLVGTSSNLSRNESYLRGDDYAGDYEKRDLHDTLDFDWEYDGEDDGIIWKTPCLDPEGPASGCIQGVYVYVRLSDGINSIEEMMLLAVNRG